MMRFRFRSRFSRLLAIIVLDSILILGSSFVFYKVVENSFEKRFYRNLTAELFNKKMELSRENRTLYKEIESHLNAYNNLYKSYIIRNQEKEKIASSKKKYQEMTEALTNKVKVISQLKSRKKSRSDLYVVISTDENKLWLRRGVTTLREFKVATGFRVTKYVDEAAATKNISITPTGVMRVRKMVKNPVWIKPDWAFTERGLPVPPLDSPLRRDYTALGPYGIYLQKRYIIHGTKNPRDLGKNVSHGCIRMISRDLKIVYNNVKIGTEVYIY